MIRKSRGSVALALTIAAASIGFAATASAATTLVVGKAAPNADPIIPVDVGNKLGIFQKHGLDLKIVDFTGGSKMATAMAANSLDIGDGAGTEMALVAKGVPMTAVCETAGPIPFIGIGVPYDSPIRSLEQLKGKTIGFSSAGSLTDWLVKELARNQGWGPQEEKKTGRLLFPVTKYEDNLASGTLYASNHLIATDPGAVSAFVAGWIETIDYIRAHKAETVKIESGITGFSESVMSKDYDLTIGMFTNDCRFDAQSLATLKRSFAELKLLPEPPDMSKLYTERFLPK